MNKHTANEVYFRRSRFVGTPPSCFVGVYALPALAGRRSLLSVNLKSGYVSRVTPPHEHGACANATLLTYLSNGEILLFIRTSIFATETRPWWSNMLFGDPAVTQRLSSSTMHDPPARWCDAHRGLAHCGRGYCGVPPQPHQRCAAANIGDYPIAVRTIVVCY